MLYDCKRISYWTDRRLAGLAGPDYDATISFGLPLEPEDSQYGKSRIIYVLTPSIRVGVVYPGGSHGAMTNRKVEEEVKGPGSRRTGLW